MNGSAAALALLLGALALHPGEAGAASMGPHGAIGTANKFGLGGHIGTEIGPSAKLWLGGGLALNFSAGLNHWYYGRAYGFRAEVNVVWHFSIVTKPKWEMLIGPGVGGGVGYWHDWWYDICNPRFDPRGPDACFAPYGKGLFHWSMLFHPWKFDIFAEPGFLLGVGIPGYFFWDWDFLAGARYYF